MDHTQLAPLVDRPEGILPLTYYLPQVVQTNLQMAEMAFKSGLLPTHVRSPQAALYLMQRGASLGLDPFFAIENTCLINGKIFLQIHAAQAILAARGVKWKINKLSPEIADLTISREGWADVPCVFTAQDAVKAGLGGKDSYRNHPADILYANAFRKGARRIAADLLMGLSIIDELELHDGPVSVGFEPAVAALPAAAEEAPKRGRPRKPPVEAAAAPAAPAPVASPEVTHDNKDYHECDSDADQLPYETFDPTLHDHREMLTRACNELGFDAKWRNENKAKIFAVLNGKPAKYEEIKKALYEQENWGAV